MSLDRILAARRRPFRASQRDDTAIVVGEPSSGTRLVARLLEAGGIYVRHDGQHGRRDWTSGRVVLVTRDPDARTDSQQARWPDGVPFDSPDTDELRARHPDAVEVAYEDVVADQDTVIARLAEAWDIEPWAFDEDVYDGNAYRGTRDRPVRRRHR